MSQFKEYFAQDHWKARRGVTIALLAATLFYVIVEAGFNARLLGVLGATEFTEGHVAAITGLEYWGRALSSVALGLALVSSFVHQAEQGVEPQPYRLVMELKNGAKLPKVAWDWKRWSFAGGVVAASMFALFHAERAWVEMTADNSTAEDRWWMFYSSRLADAALLGAKQVDDMLVADPELRKSAASAVDDSQDSRASWSPLVEDSPYVSMLDTYIHPRNFSLDTFQGPAWQTMIAITPHGMQNFARTQQPSEERAEPMRPDELQEDIEAAIEQNSDQMVGGLADSAVLAQVDFCLKAIYDQSELAGAQLDPSICVTKTATLEEFRVAHADFWQDAPQACFLVDGVQKAFVDFVTIRCVYEAVRQQNGAAAVAAYNRYVADFNAARSNWIEFYRTNPSSLPEAANIAAAVNDRLRGNSDISAWGAAAGMQVGGQAGMPACSNFAESRLEQFRRYRTQRYDAVESRVSTWLDRLELGYCEALDGLTPADPALFAARLDAETQEQFRSSVQQALQETLRANSVTRQVDLPTSWTHTDAYAFYTFVLAELMAPYDRAAQQMIGDQLDADPADLEALPDPAGVATIEQFRDNPVVRRLFLMRVGDLTDSVFTCLGIMNAEGKVRYRGSLNELMSPAGKEAFASQVGGTAFENAFRTRLTGTVADFGNGGRCAAAGIAAHHRTNLPGFALLVSLIGLLYHTRKAVLYGLRLGPMSTGARHLIAGGVVGILVAGPMMVPVDALQTRESDVLMQRYTRTHGPVFAAGAVWMVKAQATFHPVSAAIYQNLMKPLGVTFAGEIPEQVLTPQHRRIEAACGRVPQVRESEHYQLLQSVMTHRELCSSAEE